MKKTVLILSLLSVIFSGCAQDKTNDKKKASKQEVIEKPEKVQISDENLQKNISKTLDEDFVIEETKSVKEAIEVLQKTSNVIKAITEDKMDEAKEELKKLIGELEVLMTREPEVALIPVNVNYQINDVIVDINKISEITNAAQEAMDEGYYQLAKDLLNDLSSEMIINTQYLPIATYPDAMRISAALLEEGKKEEALALLVRSLNTLIVEKQVLPLPILRAEEFIKLGAEILAGEEKDKKEVALVYLDNADYQLQLAEALGYGKKDKEYKDLYKAIKELKKMVKKDKDSKIEFENLSKKIKEFKERLFYKKDTIK